MHTPFDLELFIAIADTGSLTEAARVCGVTRATVTRRLDALEESLGVPLLNRSTRQLSLTEAGIMYSSSCREVMARLRQAETQVRELDGQPRGRLRIAMPIVHLDSIVGPLVAGFSEAYPDVDVQITFSSVYADPLADGCDVALHIGFDTNPTLRARYLLREQFGLYASPTYLERKGMPQHPADLAQHDCIVALRDGARENWPLRSGGTFAVEEPRILANSMSLMRIGTLKGVGIALMARSVVREDLASGALEPVLEREVGTEQPVNLLYPESARSSPRVRCFLDFTSAWVTRHLA
jgi:DNA-binding transcriptional LysR family regulator